VKEKGGFVIYHFSFSHLSLVIREFRLEVVTERSAKMEKCEMKNDK
jgi:hypothetical protein